MNVAKRHKCHYSFRIGTFLIEDNGKAITGVHLDNAADCSGDIESDLTKEAYKQLSEYFGGKRKVFDLPICPQGTEFCQRVWEELVKIPYGETCSYADIAKRIGAPKACRAVGGANNKNPIMIIVPCHRVVGSGGGLVGYACGVDVKKALLELEKRFR